VAWAEHAHNSPSGRVRFQLYSLLLRSRLGRGNVSGQMSRNIGGLRMTGSWGPAIGTITLVASLFGCGRPATKADCDEILDKSASIELKAQNVTDPDEVKKRTEAVRAAQGEQLLAKCVGRRVTEKAMVCVRGATTAEQVDRCLD
jgi:hypothetical protein